MPNSFATLHSSKTFHKLMPIVIASLRAGSTEQCHRFESQHPNKYCKWYAQSTEPPCSWACEKLHTQCYCFILWENLTTFTCVYEMSKPGLKCGWFSGGGARAGGGEEGQDGGIPVQAGQQDEHTQRRAQAGGHPALQITLARHTVAVYTNWGIEWPTFHLLAGVGGGGGGSGSRRQN